MPWEYLPYRQRLSLSNYGVGNRPAAIVIHETDNQAKGAGALNHSVFFATPGVGVSCHYVVDEEEVIQVLGHDKVAWHCGRPLGEYSNRNTLGIEICVNGDYARAFVRAAILTGCLMEATGIEVLLRHRDVSGKDCPRIMNREGLWPLFCQLALKSRKTWHLSLKCRHRKATTTGSSACYGWVILSKANLRAGRGLDKAVVGQVGKNTVFRLLYGLAGWWSVDYGDNLAFISQKCFRLIRI